MTVRLTYAEYKKACDAGLVGGRACACMGPQNGDEYCPCAMDVLDKIVPEDRHILTEQWRQNGRLSNSEWEAFWAERDAYKSYDGKYDPPKSVYRDRRLALIAKKKEEQAF